MIPRKLYDFIAAKWHARQRRIDMQILWPLCVKQASSADHAKAAFALHAYNDPAWTCLGEDEIYRIIEGLQ
jgi:hypothetical protein